MSSRSLRVSGDALDLNIQGLAMKHDDKFKADTSSHMQCKKEIEKLKRELNAEKNNSKKMKASLSDMKKSYEDDKLSHADALSSLSKDHKEEIKRLENKHVEVLSYLKKSHKEEIQSIQNKHKDELLDSKKKLQNTFDEELNQQKEKYDDIISSKNEQIKNLKAQVADSLEINSKERHKQIDELMKELSAVSDEARYLKGVVQNFNTSSECQKCSFYENKCKEIAIELATRNETFNQLLAVCSRMESQLSQQDELCMLMSNLRGKLLQ